MTEIYRIDRTKWKKPSYLGHYDEKATQYEGLRSRCRKCEVSFVFSASDQKRAFEVDKKYPGWLPVLCVKCGSQWKSLSEVISDHEILWESKRKDCESNKSFFKKWLQALEEAKTFNIKDFDSRITMLKNELIKLQ